MQFPTRIEENPKMAILSLSLLVLVGMVSSALLFASIAYLVPAYKEILYNGSPQTAEFTRAMLFVNLPITFLLPAMYVAGKYCPGKLGEFTKTKRLPYISFLVIALVLILVSQPGLNLIGEWNKSLTLPNSFSRLMQWITQKEAESEALSKMILETNSVGVLILNILLIALLPGFCEEYLFRGVLQAIFIDWFGRKHIAVWVTAFIFSFIHFQFLGFVPRLFLGVMLGYLVLFSGSLWTSIFAHSLNNAFIVVLSYLQLNGKLSHSIDTFGTAATWWVGVISIFATYFVYSVFVKREVEIPLVE